MAIQDFVNSHNGTVVNSPHGIAGQCVALASAWSLSIGGPELWGIGDSSTAYRIWQTFQHPFYQKVLNTPDNAPKPGDIIFFAPNNPSVGTGAAGHVDVAVDGISAQAFRAFDADWGGNLRAQLVNHHYAGVLGWFTPTPQAAPPPPVPQNALTNEDAPMTPEQEKQAYDIVLGRDPEGGPDGRTAFQFILDSQGELSQKRAAKQAEIDNLNQQVRDLTDKLTAAEANPKPTPTPADPPPIAAPLTPDPTPEPPATQVPVSVDEGHHDGAIPIQKGTPQVDQGVVQIFATPPHLKLAQDALVTDLATGIDIQRVPEGTIVTISRAVRVSNQLYLQTANMEDLGHGMNEKYFQYHIPVDLANIPVPSKAQVGGVWHNILKGLHLIKENK